MASTANRPGRLELSDAMMKSLRAFARTGDSDNSAPGVAWPVRPGKLVFDATQTTKVITTQ